MQKSVRSPFLLSPYANDFSRWLAAALYAILSVEMTIHLLLIVLSSAVADQTGFGRSAIMLSNLVLLTICAAAFLLVRRGEFKTGTALLVGAQLIAGTALLVKTWNAPLGWAAFWLAVALAGLFFSPRRAGLIAGAAIIVGFATTTHGWSDLSTAAREERIITDLVLTLSTAALGAATFFIAQGGRSATHAIREEGTARHRDAIHSLIAQGLFARQEIDTFAATVAEALLGEFDKVYHAQIFLIEADSQYATLRAATGQEGQKLIDQEYKLDVGGLSVIGRSTLDRLPLLIADIHRDPIYKPHPLLPETRTELALPLLSGSAVIGALDMQAKETNAFDAADMDNFHSIAIQLAMALDGLQLYESAQRNIRENQALYQQTQGSLREIERLNYQLTGRAWSDYLRFHSPMTALTVDLENDQSTPESDWTNTLNEAARQHQVVSQTADGRRIVALPIIVRNEVIGAMEFELESEAELPDGALDLVTAVGQRLGLAMENRRLFDETQRIAHREALINDIGTDLQSATGVDAILQRTARHLQEALTAQQVTVRLGTVPNGKGRADQGRPQP